MFQLIAMIAIVLTITVAVLSLFAVDARHRANLREARIGRQRGELLEAIHRFLAEQGALDDVVAALPRDRAVALGALVSAAAAATREEWPRLRLLIDHLRLHEDDLVALAHRDWTRRAHAATRLGILRCHGATKRLVQALDDPMLDVRLAAAHALAQLQATDAIEDILRSLALPVAWPLQRCAEILHAMGPSAVLPLLAAQRSSRLPVAATTVVVRVLGMLRAPAALPVLVECLAHPDDEVRVSSAKALGEIGSAQAGPALRAALKDATWPVRSASAKALGQVRDRGAVADLATLLADGNWWVRFNAAQALHRLDAITTLRETAAGHADRFARDISRQVLEEHGFTLTTGATPAASPA